MKKWYCVTVWNHGFSTNETWDECISRAQAESMVNEVISKKTGYMRVFVIKV